MANRNQVHLKAMGLPSADLLAQNVIETSYSTYHVLAKGSAVRRELPALCHLLGAHYENDGHNQFTIAYDEKKVDVAKLKTMLISKLNELRCEAKDD